MKYKLTLVFYASVCKRALDVNARKICPLIFAIQELKAACRTLFNDLFIEVFKSQVIRFSI